MKMPPKILDLRIKSFLEIQKTPDTNKVFIYIADMNKFSNYLSFFFEYLEDYEKKQAKQYYTKLLIGRYIISHGLFKYILSFYKECSPQDIRFSTNKYGKPFLKDSKIKFNMSHSHNMVCYIVAYDNEVGIDIEFHNTVDVIELSKLVLTHKEEKIFNALSSKEQFVTFYNIWTKKEALIKAIGEGLSYPITNIEALTLVHADNTVIQSIENNIKYELYSYPLELEGDFSGAFASEKKINEIIYVQAHNHYGIFDNIRRHHC